MAGGTPAPRGERPVGQASRPSNGAHHDAQGRPKGARGAAAGGAGVPPVKWGSSRLPGLPEVLAVADVVQAQPAGPRLLLRGVTQGDEAADGVVVGDAERRLDPRGVERLEQGRADPE